MMRVHMSMITLLLGTATLLPILAASAPGANVDYTLQSLYAGADFFDHFSFFSSADPTHGFVNYLDSTTAWQQGLVSIVDTSNGGTAAYIGVDHNNTTPNGRSSIRLSSNEVFDVGTLLVVDVSHIPTGWGLWPALWMLGTDGVWPASGEIDFAEWVHETPYNSITLHTAPGCTVDNSSSDFLGQLQQTDCNAGDGSDGCSVHAPASSTMFGHSVASAGQALNQQGGAVYVTEWAETGINVWMFLPTAVPEMLNGGKVNTAGWPEPLASFAGEGCDFGQAFRKMALVIDTTFCGDWAGKVWESSGAATATGVATCDEYVANNPAAFKEAYFQINSVQFFTANGS